MARMTSRHHAIFHQLRIRLKTHSQRRIVELIKRYDGSDVDECCAIEQQIDDVGKHGVLCGLIEKSTDCELVSSGADSLPGKGTSTCKGRQQVVAPEETRNTYPRQNCKLVLAHRWTRPPG